MCMSGRIFVQNHPTQRSLQVKANQQPELTPGAKSSMIMTHTIKHSCGSTKHTQPKRLREVNKQLY